MNLSGDTKVIYKCYNEEEREKFDDSIKNDDEIFMNFHTAGNDILENLDIWSICEDLAGHDGGYCDFVVPVIEYEYLGMLSKFFHVSLNVYSTDIKNLYLEEGKDVNRIYIRYLVSMASKDIALCEDYSFQLYDHVFDDGGYRYINYLDPTIKYVDL